ncbi:MAG: hypothetical protein KGL92_14450 [Gammaproteobacteria bacterium]|nr:hypothetical protein [Gammaproteobacteria bacterium]
MKNAYWLIRGELWENRAIWIAPASIGVLSVLAALFGKADVDASAGVPPYRMVGGLLLFAFGIVFFLAMSIYSAWYLLDSLHTERKDHSILFWKSLPITDAETVLAKLATALIVIPLVYFAAADVTTVLIAFIVSVRASSWFGASLWRADLWLQLQALWVYLIVTSAVWFLPVAGWLMLISAWARRALGLWSILPPLALIWAERAFFGTGHVAAALSARLFTGYPGTAFHGLTETLLRAAGAGGADPSFASVDVWTLLDPADFLRSPATWTGLAIGAALIVGTIRIRSRAVGL